LKWTDLVDPVHGAFEDFEFSKKEEINLSRRRDASRSFETRISWM
jgi:hypothetical protein